LSHLWLQRELPHVEREGRRAAQGNGERQRQDVGQRDGLALGLGGHVLLVEVGEGHQGR